MTTIALPQPITLDTTARRTPALGGFNLTTLGLEMKRMLRNRRTIIFNLLFPPAMLLSFSSSPGMSDSVGNGNVAAYVMVSLALYAAVMSAAATGAGVSMERAQGWSRQLRLTPLHPVAYIVIKALVAVLMAAFSITVVNAVALFQGKSVMPTAIWLECAGMVLLCSMVFAAFGLFVGYLLPGENAMQILGPGLAVLAFLGDVFIPIAHGSTMYHISQWTPMFGVVHVARAPLTGELDWTAVLNVVVWLTVFIGGAAWRMSRDTARG